MINILTSFAKNESGAVTVDWVVLTASVAGLAVGVILSLSSSSTNFAANISEQIEQYEVIED